MAPAEAKKEEDEEADKELNDQVQRRNSGTAVAGARDGGKVTLDVTNLVGAGNGGGGHKFAKSFKQVLAEERARVQAAAPLHKLIVSGCQLTDVSLLALSEWPYLRQLSVSRCDELTDTGGVALATNCSRLKVCGSGSYRAPHALTSRRAALHGVSSCYSRCPWHTATASAMTPSRPSQRTAPSSAACPCRGCGTLPTNRFTSWEGYECR